VSPNVSKNMPGRPACRLGRAHKALLAATDLQTTDLQTTGLRTTGLQTTGLRTTGLRTIRNAAVAVITIGSDCGCDLADADHRSPGWLKLLAIQAVALARVNL
jgi:hypothetical protein